MTIQTSTSTSKLVLSDSLNFASEETCKPVDKAPRFTLQKYDNCDILFFPRFSHSWDSSTTASEQTWQSQDKFEDNNCTATTFLGLKLCTRISRPCTWADLNAIRQIIRGSIVRLYFTGKRFSFNQTQIFQLLILVSSLTVWSLYLLNGDPSSLEYEDCQ